MTLLDTALWDDRALHGGKTSIIEPATGQSLGSTGVADAVDISEAAAKAQAAQRDWGSASFEVRAAVLRKAGALIEENAEELQRWVIRETGAVGGLAGFATYVAAQECYEAAALASRPIGEILPTAQPRLSLLKRVPVGVVGVISPFNVPLILSTRSVAPALAAGNAVVLKPDLRTSISGGYILAKVFEA